MSSFCAASFKGVLLPAQPHLAVDQQLAALPLRALCELRRLCVNSFLSLSESQLSPNSFRITSFADPHPLTPIESYLCKKGGRGSPLPQVGGEGLHIGAQHTGIRATPIFSDVYFTSSVHPRGVGARRPPRLQLSTFSTH